MGLKPKAATCLLDHGINIFLGTKKAILAAACSVVQPQPFHPRLSQTEAEQLSHVMPPRADGAREFHRSRGLSSRRPGNQDDSA